MISKDEYQAFVGQTFDGLVSALEQLGDEHAGHRLDTAGANTPFALVTHCLGVVEFWAGHVVHGRPSDRDRDAEFRASGRVADLLARVAATHEQLVRDLLAADPQAAPVNRPDDLEPEFAWIAGSQGAVFLHVYQELTQHLGQLEVTRDVLLAHGEQG